LQGDRKGVRGGGEKKVAGLKGIPWRKKNCTFAKQKKKFGWQAL